MVNNMGKFRKLHTKNNLDKDLFYKQEEKTLDGVNVYRGINSLTNTINQVIYPIVTKIGLLIPYIYPEGLSKSGNKIQFIDNTYYMLINKTILKNIRDTILDKDLQKEINMSELTYATTDELYNKTNGIKIINSKKLEYKGVRIIKDIQSIEGDRIIKGEPTIVEEGLLFPMVYPDQIINNKISDKLFYMLITKSTLKQIKELLEEDDNANE